MNKADKKRKVLQDRIDELEKSLKNSLSKKNSKTLEINVPATLRKIADLKSDLSNL